MSEIRNRVRIQGGTYNGEDVSHLTFTQVSEYLIAKTGVGYIKVDGRETDGLADRVVRISCGSPEHVVPADDGMIFSDDELDEVESSETDEEIVERLRVRFQMLEQMTAAVKEGHIRGMIVSGAPGVGKSHGVEHVLNKYEFKSKVSKQPLKFEIVRGATSPLGLYMKLYELKDENSVVVFDDCDTVLLDDLSLNILKAALDSKSTRTIAWNTNSHALNKEDIPNSFEFKGAVIFITNISFENIRSKKLREHLMALESRCHYMNLTITTKREKVLRIKQITQDGMLRSRNIDDETVDDIIEFVEDNKDNLRELSLRTVSKIADLVKAFPKNWQAFAENTVMKTS